MHASVTRQRDVMHTSVTRQRDVTRQLLAGAAGIDVFADEVLLVAAGRVVPLVPRGAEVHAVLVVVGRTTRLIWSPVGERVAVDDASARHPAPRALLVRVAGVQPHVVV